MLILLSPAKTMNMSPTAIQIHESSPRFENEAELLAGKMRLYSPEELAKLLKISPQLAAVNYDRYQRFNNQDTPRKAALFAYDGSVFKAISAGDFSPEDLTYAQERIRIISTLYGVVRPLDRIKAYRIAFNLKLQDLPGNLYNYWHNKLTDTLIDDCTMVGGLVVNLASLDIQASLEMARLCGECSVITPEFWDMKHGKYEPIRTYTKIARGAMARFIIKERVETLEALMAFSWSGYKFNSTLSDEKRYIYTR